jgi:flagellar hook-associated protein 1
MPDLSSGIQTALSAVLAHSQTMEIIEHNVANANTPGYRRQSANLVSAVATPVFGAEPGMYAGQRGSGVLIADIQRFSLGFFDTRYRSVAADTASSDTRASVLSQLETTLSETSTDGLIPHMDEFFSSWNSLASDPTNTALRQNVLNTTKSLTDAFNRRSQQINQIRTDQNLAIEGQVDQINTMAKQVAALNGEISRVLSVGEQPNDLLDKRDLLLDQLAQASGAVSYPQKNGEVIVSLAGHALVSGHDTFALQTIPDTTSPANTGLSQVVFSDAPAALVKVSGGTLKGLFDARDGAMLKQLTGLDELASQLVSAVNTEHVKGNGNAGVNFFDPTKTTAATISLDGALTANTVMTSATAGTPGDSALANVIADLKKNKYAFSTGTNSMSDFYNAQVTDLGLQVQRAKNDSTSNNLVFKALGDQRESVSGVSLDEEAANLSKAQKAYQAAARVMNAYDEMLDKIINGMGLVGR